MNAVSADTICSIPLTQGLYAIVDRRDFERLSKYSYCAKKIGNNWYAGRGVTNANKKSRPVYIHQDIMGTKEGFEIDHINCNGLDNRRANLRFCTHQQNQHNRRKISKHVCKYKGVTFYKGRYRAKIVINKKQINLGCYDGAIEAAQAYDLAAIEHFGQFARINEYTREELENGKL